MIEWIVNKKCTKSKLLVKKENVYNFWKKQNYAKIPKDMIKKWREP